MPFYNITSINYVNLTINSFPTPEYEIDPFRLDYNFLYLDQKN